MKELNIYKQTAKMVAFTVVSLLLCRLSKGYFTPIFVLAGVWCAFSSKIGWALVYFVLMPFFVIINPGIFPKNNALVGYSLRFGPLLIGLLLAMMSGRRVGHHRLPLGMLLPFLGVACISSATGWVPLVSYMKIANFLVFLICVWYGTQNLQDRPQDIFLLRSFFLALAVVLILGSYLLMPFPSIAYATSLTYALREGGTVLADEVFRNMQAEGVRTLFCGITNHSQALAPMMVCSFTWVLCDMLFIERRFRRGHILLVILALPLLFLTRSRVGLVSLVFSLAIVTLYTARKVNLPMDIKRRLTAGMFWFLASIALIAVVAQLRSGVMNEWVRKTNDVESDRRTLTEALTESRQGLIAYSMYEFHRNPLIGSGFQVAEYTRDQIRGTKGLIVSASIEKGILPVMVLGETGLLGAFFFAVFVFSFYVTCSRRRYFVTITMFSVLLMTNMGEASFFSPGGGGGFSWIVCVVGGFTIDTILLHRRNVLSQWAAMAADEYNHKMLANQRLMNLR